MKKSFCAVAQSLVNAAGITGVGLTVLLMPMATRLNAANYTHLHEFADFGDHSAMPCGESICGPVLSGHTLYGMLHGWSGTIYKVNLDGSGFAILYDFHRSDGPNPPIRLAASDHTLYGAWQNGATTDEGYVFRINTDGTGFTNIYNFSELDGSIPCGPLAVSGKTLYGATSGGGPAHAGTVFRVSTDGADFANLHNFSAGISDGKFAERNADGLGPKAGLVLSGNTLYGITTGGGQAGFGTIFRVNTDGTGFTNLHNFTGASDNEGASDGLVLSGHTLYGTTDGGGAGNGTVFQINTDGTGYTNIYSFGQSEGHHPCAGLLLLGRRLYGATWGGGDSDSGTFFEIGTDGAGFKTIHQFSGMDGEFPKGPLVSSGDTLYGTTQFEGTNGIGAAVFALTLPSP
jgi:uncharacterized repeat protein (TIGR03803 family)